MNSKGEFFLTGTVVGGVFVIRVVSATTTAEEKWLKKIFDILVEGAEEKLGKGKEGA